MATEEEKGSNMKRLKEAHEGLRQEYQMIHAQAAIVLEALKNHTMNHDRARRDIEHWNNQLQWMNGQQEVPLQRV